MNDFTITAKNTHRETIYYPEKRPGFVAWTTAFDYGDGSVGLSFKETKQEHNNAYKPPKLEMGEAVGAPVSYCSVECGSESEESYRVYMRSEDCGKTWRETGRCQLEQGSFCNAGFADGHIIGYDVPRINDEGTGWCDYIEVRESKDGGSTWAPVTRLLEGCAPYLWRLRRLNDGTVVLLASLYGTPWGEGYERATRNTMLPGETYLSKIQTLFLTSRDGRSFSEPHYILPGTGAHEFDFVELQDGSLLFIAGDVQATPVARQIVKRTKGGWINGTLFGIRKGAPPDPAKNPQGGYVPETMVLTKDGLIVGSRRNKPYSCSNDLGENWYPIEGLESSLYQPFMLSLPDGTIANFGHFGGDSAFGQIDMFVGADYFTVPNTLPKAGTLTLQRVLSPDGSHYENRFRAVFTSNGKPLAGAELWFRFNPFWSPNGTVSSIAQENAPQQVRAATDAQGVAFASVPAFDLPGDIHFGYTADVVYEPGENGAFASCVGPSLSELALAPWRQNRYPYDAYFAEGTLYLSPIFLQDFPDAMERLAPFCGKPDGILPADALPQKAIDRLAACGVLQKGANGLKWVHSIHAPVPLDKLLPMAEGDWYI